MTEKQTLHVWTDDAEWVVASSLDDVRAVLREHRGDDDILIEDFTKLPDDKVITISDEDGSGKTSKTAAEWAAENGRGFLCSTEY